MDSNVLTKERRLSKSDSHGDRKGEDKKVESEGESASVEVSRPFNQSSSRHANEGGSFEFTGGRVRSTSSGKKGS